MADFSQRVRSDFAGARAKEMKNENCPSYKFINLIKSYGLARAELEALISQGSTGKGKKYKQAYDLTKSLLDEIIDKYSPMCVCDE